MERAAALRAAIRRLTEALSVPLPASEIHQIIVEEARRITDAAGAALCLLAREDRAMLDYVAAASSNAEELVGLRVKVADSLFESVLEKGRPARFDARLGDRLTAPGLQPSRTAAIVPIFRDGKPTGALTVLNKGGDTPETAPAFDDTDIDTLQTLAEIASLARKVEKTARTAREQSRELAVLYDAAKTVAGSLNVHQVLDSVLEAICTHVEYHTAVLFLLNDERTHLFIAADRGLTEDERAIQWGMNHGLAARVLDSGAPLLVRDMEAEEDFQSLSENATDLSAMFVPIISREDMHGLIVVTSLQRNAYTKGDLNLLSAVGMQAGIAIENAYLYEDAQRRAEEATALYDLSQHVNATLHLDRVLNFVADSVLNLLKVDKFALMLHDKREGRLTTRVTRHLDAEGFAAICPKVGDGVGEGIAGWVFEWQTPQAVSDVIADPRNRTAPVHQFGVASTLCVPMHVGENVIGVIHAISGKRRLFTVAEMELLYTIANQAASAIANATRYNDSRLRTLELRRYFQRVASALGSALDGRDLPQLLADLALAMMEGDRCAVYQVDGEETRLLATSHFRTSAPPDASVPLGQGLTGWVARRGQSLIIADLDADTRSQAHGWLRRDKQESYLGIPLKLDRRTVGVIEIYTQQSREFSPDEARLLSTFARRARLAHTLVLEPSQILA